MSSKTGNVARKFSISNSGQLSAISSPVRQVILAALLACKEPVAIKEVAAHLSRSPESLYYHFRAMEKAGLVIEMQTRLENGKPVKLYSPIAREIRIQYDIGNSGFRKAICKVLDATVRLVSRDFRKGLECKNVRCNAVDRNLYIARGESWLTKNQLKQINRHVNKINEIMNANVQRSEGERCSVFFAMSPLESEEQNTT